METHTIFFIGKPGSGKGTQAKLLSEKTGWPVKAASDGLREIIKEGGTAGKKLKETMDAGGLVPSWVPSYVFIKWLFTSPEKSSVIFDGFNRKIEEATLIINSLKWIERPFTVFHLHTSDDEVRKRLVLRKEKEGRADDHDHVVTKRFEEYYANTEPTLELFKDAGVLIEIDGEQTPEEISANICTILNIK